ncbi:MAG: cytidine deaminase [Bacteroidales bacterium]|nr:cytidine deaminase [Bacteroidales bacterium]
MKEIDFVAKISIYPYTELSDRDKNLIAKSQEAQQGSYAPYSNFCVGSAVECAGMVVLGSNQENEAYPSGMCAERVALYSASAQNPNAIIEAIAVTAYDKNREEEILAFPCGACRQVLLEYENRQNIPIRIIIYAKQEAYIIESAKSLLPFSFNMK